MELENILTYEDLSKILNRSVSALRHDVMNNRIPYIKIGEGRNAHVRFIRAEINAWLSSKIVPAKRRSK